MVEESVSQIANIEEDSKDAVQNFEKLNNSLSSIRFMANFEQEAILRDAWNYLKQHDPDVVSDFEELTLKAPNTSIYGFMSILCPNKPEKVTAHELGLKVEIEKGSQSSVFFKIFEDTIHFVNLHKNQPLANIIHMIHELAHYSNTSLKKYNDLVGPAHSITKFFNRIKNRGKNDSKIENYDLLKQFLTDGSYIFLAELLSDLCGDNLLGLSRVSEKGYDGRLYLQYLRDSHLYTQIDVFLEPEKLVEIFDLTLQIHSNGVNATRLSFGIRGMLLNKIKEVEQTPHFNKNKMEINLQDLIIEVLKEISSDMVKADAQFVQYKEKVSHRFQNVLNAVNFAKISQWQNFATDIFSNTKPSDVFDENTYLDNYKIYRYIGLFQIPVPNNPDTISVTVAQETEDSDFVIYFPEQIRNTPEEEYLKRLSQKKYGHISFMYLDENKNVA